jgi:hypothetical protein
VAIKARADFLSSLFVVPTVSAQQTKSPHSYTCLYIQPFACNFILQDSCLGRSPNDSSQSFDFTHNGRAYYSAQVPQEWQ